MGVPADNFTEMSDEHARGIDDRKAGHLRALAFGFGNPLRWKTERGFASIFTREGDAGRTRINRQPKVRSYGRPSHFSTANENAVTIGFKLNIVAHPDRRNRQSALRAHRAEPADSIDQSGAAPIVDERNEAGTNLQTDPIRLQEVVERDLRRRFGWSCRFGLGFFGVGMRLWFP